MSYSGGMSTFDPTFRQYPLQLQQKQPSPHQPHQSHYHHFQPQPDILGQRPRNGISESPHEERSDPAQALGGFAEKPILSEFVPIKLAESPILQVARSASQPGVKRAYANGLSSRSHSPAPSNASFHGNGHPRRGNSRSPFTNVGLSGVNNEVRRVSAGGATGSRAIPQRVPTASEFPALVGPAVPHGDSKREVPVNNGMTAAEVLSLARPTKPPVGTVARGDNDQEEEQSVGTPSEENASC